VLKINIITLFPNLISNFLNELPLKRAITNNIVNINIVDLKKYAINSYGSVDSKPSGGGVGMVLRIEPIYNALIDIHQDIMGKDFDDSKNSIILLSPKGTKYNQQTAKNFANKNSITLISGRYEGIDARVEKLCTNIISIGDYVLSGGELPSLVIMESVVRLLPGVLPKPDATQLESFEDDFLEFPQYTRPKEFMGYEVPKILLSGDHKKILNWKKENSKKVTKD